MQAKYFSEDLDGTTLDMVLIPGGKFKMGVPDNKTDHLDDKKPQHEVVVPEFFRGRFEVTRDQWRHVARMTKIRLDLPEDPSFHKDSWQQLIEQISWYLANEFCDRLTKKTGRYYRLPSEAEWEYAARAGTTSTFAFGANINPAVVNYDGLLPYGKAPKGLNRRKTVKVGSLGIANAFGLFDMHGNVIELCADRWHRNYIGAPNDGSVWIDGGEDNNFVTRGGSFDTNARSCSSTHRRYFSTLDQTMTGISDHGFRVVCDIRGR